MTIPPIYPALIFTVALIVTTAYFLMGGLPLLILKHDTPMDARFVRGFFNLYYKVAIGMALGACASYIYWGRYGFAVADALIALIAVALRQKLIPAMQHFGTRIEDQDEQALRNFRKIHRLALSINFVQLVLLVWSTTKLGL